MNTINPNRRERVKKALTFFSITAYFTGVMLLLLVAAMITIYGIIGLDFGLDTAKPRWFTIIAIIHGYCYMAFLIAVVNLGTRARWEPSKWMVTALGGVVPFLSFIVERKRRDEVEVAFKLK